MMGEGRPGSGAGAVGSDPVSRWLDEWLLNRLHEQQGTSTTEAPGTVKEFSPVHPWAVHQRLDGAESLPSQS